MRGKGKGGERKKGEEAGYQRGEEWGMHDRTGMGR